MGNTKVTRILCLCSLMVVWILGLSLRKEAKMKRRMIPRRKECKHIKDWSLGPYIFALMISCTQKLIDPKINNMLLVTWAKPIFTQQSIYCTLYFYSCIFYFFFISVPPCMEWIYCTIKVKWNKNNLITLWYIQWRCHHFYVLFPS
jgi:hypothetical protein